LGGEASHLHTSCYATLASPTHACNTVVVHMLDIAMSNAYLIYKMLGGAKPQVWFRQQAIRCLLLDDARFVELAGKTFCVI